MSKIFPYKRILIVGCGGAGKSTLARKMGEAFSLPVVHLDKLWWLPGWRERSQEEFDILLAAQLNKPRWIIDGNYMRTFEKRLCRADLCIVLDLPSEVCIASVYERAERYRGTTRPDMTEGCEEEVHDDFKEWIASYRANVLPKMLQVLRAGGVPYLVFSDRERAVRWMEEYCL